MDIPDMVTGLFNIVGAGFLLTNVEKIYKDKCVKGVRIAPTAFFTLWGLWNMFYYPHLGQMLSFVGGFATMTVNLMWISMAVYYSRRH